ncbi:putative transposase, partial [Enterococcus sp. C1]
MNDSIKKMLRIIEKDLMITEVSYETLQKKKTLVVDAVLSPTPRACRSCGSTHWTAQSYFVQPRHSIANHVRYKIASLLTEKVSLSFIAKSCQVSLTTVIRTLKEFKSYLPKQSKKILPRVLMVDEFR